MSANKKSGRIIGVLFLLMFIPGSISVSIKGLSRSLTESDTFLQDVFESANEMKISALLGVLAGIIGLLLAIKFFQIIKGFSLAIALWYFGLWIAQSGVAIIGEISHLSLISLSKKFVLLEAADPNIYNALGSVHYYNYIWSHFVSLMMFSMAAVILYYALFKYKLIPMFLGVWGMIAVSIVFTATLLQSFGVNVSFFLYLQNGIHLLFLSAWLMIKGFKDVDVTAHPISD